MCCYCHRTGIQPQEIALTPAAITCSVESRISPRYTYLRLHGLEETSLGSMVLPTTTAWATRQNVCEEEFLQWCSKADE